MAITSASPDDELTSSLWNELASLINGTSGGDDPVKFIRHNDAAVYSLTVNNVDTTNGLAAKFTYGAVGSETTIATFAKAGVTFSVPVTLTGGLAIIDAAGDLIYGSAADTPARLAIGTAFQELTVNSGATAPQWSTGVLKTVTTAGDTVYATGANAITRLAIGTARQALLTNSGATAPEWGASLQSLMTTTGDVVYASSANTPARLALGTKGYGLLAGASAPLYDPVARKNRLVNGDMRVKQRAVMPTTDDSYCLDRWILLLEAANAATVAQETSDVPTDGSNRAIKLTVGSGEDNKFGIVQILEFADCADLRGKTVSLQFKMKSTAGITNVRAAVIEWTSTADSVTSDVVGTWGSENTNPTLATNWAYCSGYTPVSLAATTSWAPYKIEGVSVGASTNNLGVIIWVDDETTTQTTDILRITDVQLEEGSICTSVERRKYSEEFSDCQWWLQIFTAQQYGIYEFGAIQDDTHADFGPFIRRPMRSGPALTVTAADWGVALSGTPITCTAISLLYAYASAVWMRATVASGLGANPYATFLTASTTTGGGQLILSAEL